MTANRSAGPLCSVPTKVLTVELAPSIASLHLEGLGHVKPTNNLDSVGAAVCKRTKRRAAVVGIDGGPSVSGASTRRREWTGRGREAAERYLIDDHDCSGALADVVGGRGGAGVGLMLVRVDDSGSVI